MKRFPTLILLLSISLFASSQYYNPYITPQNLANAYRYGQELAKKIAREQDERDAKSVNACLSRITEAIACRKFSEAEEWAEKLYNLREDLGYYYLGFTNELQGYGNYAKIYYSRGASKSVACQNELNRINTYGPATEQQIEHAVQNFQYHVAFANAASTQIVNSIWSNSTSSSKSSSGSSCPRCHGTGIESSPNCVGNPYAGANAAAQGLVGYTHTNGGRCPYCGKYEYHIHYKCYDSNYH